MQYGNAHADRFPRPRGEIVRRTTNLLPWRTSNNNSMVTQTTEQSIASPGGVGRFRQIWFVTVQVAVLALLALSLAWSPAPIFHYRILLGLLAMASLAVALVPALRRHQIAALLGGLTLATACWLSGEHTWNLPVFANADPPAAVPFIAPVVLGVALVLGLILLIFQILALLRVIPREARFHGAATFTKASLAVAAILTVFSLVCWGVINFTPSLRALEYQVSLAQISEMLASVLTFSLALWLGGAAINKESRWSFLPLGTVFVLAVFFVIWHLR